MPWLTALGVTFSSAAASLKLCSRQATSKKRKADSGGRRVLDEGRCGIRNDGYFRQRSGFALMEPWAVPDKANTVKGQRIISAYRAGCRCRRQVAPLSLFA